jgi:hypothetical protein
MRLVTVLAAVIFAFIAATTSTQAQGRGAGQAKKTTVSAPRTKAPTPKQTAKADTRAAKTTAKADARAAKTTARADARASKATAKADARTAKAATKAARTSGTTTTTSAEVTPTTPMTKQDARLLAMLPPGTDLQLAAQGFKNRGQFIAAVNASNNHGIPFADLKARMTGIALDPTVPATTPMSLGQAIQSFKVTTTTTTATTTTTTAPQP